MIVFEAFDVSGDGGGMTVVAIGALKTVAVGVIFGAAAAVILAMLLRRYLIRITCTTLSR